MQFIKNIWYAGGWGADIGRDPLVRKITGTPVVLYRTEAGEAVALSNICPHRFASLGSGRLNGDDIECPYHGLRFGTDGRCVHNPHGPVIPENAKVRSFPVAERDGLVWIWMGEVELADESLIARFPMLDQHERFAYTSGQTMIMQVNYELITDNLLDISHAAYIHAEYFGSENLVPGKIATRREGNAIWSDRVALNSSAPKIFWETGACEPDDRVDFWVDTQWTAPANFYLYGGIAKPGHSRDECKEVSTVQILTPISETETYYFYTHFRNYRQDDVAMTEAMEAAIVDVFRNEDEATMLPVQENMGASDFWDLRPVILPGDNAAVQVRRARERLLKAEVSVGRVLAA
jgi:nitrite reductase/ring-hydroxylating ferredoxin subunit